MGKRQSDGECSPEGKATCSSPLPGLSVRGTERISGVYRNTVMRLLLRFGNACHDWLDESINNLTLEHVELDEMWTFCKKKDKKRTDAEKRDDSAGSQYLFLALDQRSKLIASYLIGKRTEQNTRRFVTDLSDRMHVVPDRITPARPQVSTDGWPAYYPAIRDAFTQTVRHGVVIKQYVNPEVGRYAPPDMKKTVKSNVNGISDMDTICTSHVERQNLTVRTFMKRFTRLALGFSKKLDNLKAAVALFVAHHNFCWRLREKGNSGKLLPTPAMQNGLAETLWSLEDLFDEVNRAAKLRKSIAVAKRINERRGGSKVIQRNQKGPSPSPRIAQ